MNLREYYNFPEDANVNLRYTSFFDEQPDNFPCPSNMRYAFAHQEIRYALKHINTSNVTNMNYMFYYGQYLVTIPQIDTSNVTNMSYMFQWCNNLLTIPQIDTSNVTTMAYMFNSCSKLTSIPQIDTSKVTDMYGMFSDCTKLASLPALNCGSITTKNTYPLKNYNNYIYLTDVGGFLGMKMSWDEAYGLAKCPNLSYESCINILNGLYDFTGNGETPNSNQGKLKVHSNFINLVGNEINIAVGKGWVVTA